MSKTRNIARYILNKKCKNMYENEDADQLRGNSVTLVAFLFTVPLSRHFHSGKPMNLILVINIHRQARASQCI